MLLVVLGHVLIWSGVKSSTSVFLSFIISVNMPLFFFVSGFFAFRPYQLLNKERILDIAKRRFQALIVGTFVFWALFHYVFDGHYSLRGGFGAYWFTIVLFQMFVCYISLSLISKLFRHDLVLPVLIPIALLSCGLLFIDKLDYPIAKCLNWASLAQDLQFFTLGLICQKYRSRFFYLLENGFWVTLCICGYICCMMLTYSDWLSSNFGFIASLNRNVLVKYLGLFSIIVIFYRCPGLSVDASMTGRLLRFIGKRTLDIYFIHYFFLPNVDGVAEWLTSGNRIIFQLLYSALITIAVTAITLGVSRVLRISTFLSTWLFGVKTNRENPNKTPVTA